MRWAVLLVVVAGCLAADGPDAPPGAGDAVGGDAVSQIHLRAGIQCELPPWEVRHDVRSAAKYQMEPVGSERLRAHFAHLGVVDAGTYIAREGGGAACGVWDGRVYWLESLEVPDGWRPHDGHFVRFHDGCAEPEWLTWARQQEEVSWGHGAAGPDAGLSGWLARHLEHQGMDAQDVQVSRHGDRWDCGDDDLLDEARTTGDLRPHGWLPALPRLP